MKHPSKENWLDRNHLGFLNMALYVFWPHSRRDTDEISNYKIMTAKGLNGLWPRPWIYSRALLLFVVSFAMLYACCIVEGKGADSTLLPGMIVVGVLTVPLSVLLFFYECNVFRSIPLLTVLRFFLIGSCVSIVITFICNLAFDRGLKTQVIAPLPSYIEIGLRALFEEFSKTLIIFIFLMRYRTKIYILQGMLVGAAVGTGFAVFESAGYALIGNGDLLRSIIARGLMSPAVHTAWGALVGGGTMMIAKGRLRYRFMLNPKFSLLFLFVSVLHFLWNFLWDTSNSLTPCLQLGVATWFLLLMMQWAGVMQTRKFKRMGYLPVEA